MRRTWAVALLIAGAAPMAAQEPAPPMFRCDTTPAVDRVVAVVGDAPVLASQLEEEIFSQRAANGGALPQTAAAFEGLCRQVLSDIIDGEVLVQVAQRDTSIKVSDQEISDGVEQQYRNVRQRFTSEVDFRAELARSGFQTPEEFRRWLTDNQRKAALRNRLLAKLRESGKLKPVQPTESEMRAYFDDQKDQLPQRPETVSFRNIVVAPRPQPAAKERARLQADSIAEALRAGGDFATAVKRFSADPGSREQGGELGWFRRGVMVPEFDQIAFKLKPGAISDPVETPFGFHIIQVQRVQPAEVQARHILIMPEITQADADSAEATAARVAEAWRNGAPFDSLVKLYHDEGEEKEATDVPVTQLPEEYKTGMANVDSGQIAPVFAIRKELGLRRKYVVLQVTQRRTEGAIRYEDVKDEIRKRLGESLSIRRYVERLRRSTYIDVRI